MKKTAAVVALTLAILGISATALARATHQTTFVHDGFQPLSDNTNKSYLVGHLKSNEPKCVRGRKVTVTFLYDMEGSEGRVVDHLVSSDKGSASGIGPTEHNGHTLAAAGMSTPKKTLKNGETCSAAQFAIG